MAPPQLPSHRARPRPRPGESSVPAVNRAPPASLSSCTAAASAKIARRASAPDLTALPAASRPRPTPPASSSKLAASPPPHDRKQQLVVRPTPPPQQQQHHRGQLVGAPHHAAAASRPRQPSTLAKNNGAPHPHPHPHPQPRGGPFTTTTPSALTTRPAPPSVPRRRDDAGGPASASSFMAPRGALQTVRPARRLAPGTAVYVRTAFRPRNVNCRILLWLPARVVSASDAYHLSVKYAADLNDMFAGKIVSKPVDHVRVAPHRTAAAAAAAKAEPRKTASLLSRPAMIESELRLTCPPFICPSVTINQPPPPPV